MHLYRQDDKVADMQTITRSHTCIQAVMQAKQAGKETYIQPGTEAGRHTGKATHRRTSRQVSIHAGGRKYR